MKMTILRMKLQDKLRKRFKYHTSSERGAYLEKQNASDTLADGDNGIYYRQSGRIYTKVHDLSFEIDGLFHNGDICIRIETRHDYGSPQNHPVPKERFVKTGEGYAWVSVEELETICQIAREVMKECKETTDKEKGE